jgi:Flp pilus assembly pilin Flp
MKKFLTRSWHEEKGQDSAEYALMFIMICATVIAVLQIMGVSLKNNFTHVSSAMAGFSASGPAASSGSAGQPASGGGNGGNGGGNGGSHYDGHYNEHGHLGRTN